MDEIAIQQDATGTTEEQGTAARDDGQQQVALSPREAAIAAIEEQIARQREDQGEAAPEGGTPAEAPTSDASNNGQQQGQQAAPAATDPSHAQERMLTVKIDGVEMQLPESEVIKGFQKDQAASRRLEEAALKLKEIEERERLLQEKEQLGSPGATTPTQQEQQDDGNGADELARKIMDGFVEGNLEEAAQALAQALKGKTPADATPTVDASQVEEIIQRQLSARELEADYQKAKEMFDTTYDDINQNPRMAQLANNIYFEHLEAGKRPSEAAKLAGDEVRTLFAPPPPPPPQAQQQSRRQERKQGIDSITPAAAPVAAPGQDTASNDPNAVIAEMKRARGQT